MPTYRTLTPEELTLIREFTESLRDYNKKYEAMYEKLDLLYVSNTRQETELAHVKADVAKIKKYVFEGNGTPSVLARLTHLEGILSKAWALALGLVTTGAGGFLAYYLGTK